MMPTMRHLTALKNRLIAPACALMALLAAPGMVSAQDEPTIVDARLENYPQSVTLTGSTALTWLLLVVLVAICVAVVFKNANRSHLD